VADID